MKGEVMTDEEGFLKEHPTAKRLSGFDSATTRAYMTNRYFLLFDTSDGHLAWKYDLEKEQVLYECEHIKQGRRMALKRSVDVYEPIVEFHEAALRLYINDPEIIKQLRTKGNTVLFESPIELHGKVVIAKKKGDKTRHIFFVHENPSFIPVFFDLKSSKGFRVTGNHKELNEKRRCEEV